MQPQKTAKTIIIGEETRAKLVAGAEKVFGAVKSTYGPAGNNVMYGDQLGNPVLTRDGVTVAKQIELSDEAENYGAQLVVSASSQTNKLAGDGTTATVILTYYLIKKAIALIAAGHNPMEVRKRMQDNSQAVLEWLKGGARDLPEEDLVQVATVSCGDAEVGKLIAATIQQVGLSGGVNVEKSTDKGVSVDIVKGFFFESGLPTTASVKIELENVLVLPLDKQLTSLAEIAPILKYVHNSPTKRVLIVGELGGDALNNFIANLNNAAYEGMLVKGLGYGTERTEFLEDLALATGAKVLRAGNVINESTIGNYFGKAGKVTVTERSTTIIDAGGAEEDVKTKAAEIDSKLDKAEDYRRELTQKRINRLGGKIALLRVGGDSEVEADELKFRVDDAVQATKAAWEEGVVPGGATALVHASKIKDIDPMFAEALQEPFREMMLNGNERADYRIEQLLRAKWGHGFNLRDITPEPVDLLKAGIVDPYKVIRLIVANATSVASNLITTNCIIHKEVKNDDSNNSPTNS